MGNAVIKALKAAYAKDGKEIKKWHIVHAKTARTES